MSAFGAWDAISECILWMIFFCVGYWQADYLLIRLPGVIVWEYETIFNTKNFKSNTITALCSRNRSAVLTYRYIHKHTSSCLLESEDDGHTHTNPWSRVHKHTYIS